MVDLASFTRLGQCIVNPTAHISPGTVIGKPFRRLIGIAAEEDKAVTVIGSNVYVGYYSLIGSGTVVEADVVVDDFSVIECEVVLGQGSLVIYRAQICNEAHVGRACVIGGFIAERVVVGDRSRVFGKIVHTQLNPGLSWDAPEAMEGSAVVEEDVFIGFDSLIIGQITVGAGAYICGGAIITKDVPSKHVAHGVNKIVPYSEWRGRLRESPYFHSRGRRNITEE